ncbi:hypothetical protein PP240_gp24 [Streptococcus phage P7574]|uniref:Uncharacterized protein n=1 Tax=Streptococcus phage P7574 TaxID=1971430 RepID=A0A286QR60_9CAUD|nr:hypothetical protein PP240_gp24 [Streptococcus phage P7574]ARU13916.1 hypothetical protein P7574_24 [Streptococcus phage P7574]
MLGLFLCYNMNEMSIPPHPFMDRYVLSGGFFVLLFFNLTARNSPTSKVAGCKGFGLVQ